MPPVAPANPTPVSTGSGTDVETASSLLSALKDLVPNTPLPPDTSPRTKHHHVASLNNFESYSKGTIKEAEDEDLTTEKLHWKETNEFSSGLSARAKRLHSAILQATTSSPDNIASIADLKQEIVRLEAELNDMDGKLEEIARARNEAVASERRVRRGLYRLASGRMTLEDVLKVSLRSFIIGYIFTAISCSSDVSQKSPHLPSFRPLKKKTMVFLLWKPLQ